MRIKTELVCRAHGYVYELLSVAELPAGHSVVIRHSPADPATRLTPCRLFSIRSCVNEETIQRYVVICPIVDIKQVTYTLEELDGVGSVVESTARAISMFWAKWLSRVNYRIRPRACSEIRGYDFNSGTSKSQLAVRQIIPDGSDMVVRVSFQTRFTGNNVCHFACLDSRLAVIDAQPIDMGSSRTTSPQSPGIELWSHLLSVRVPRNLANFTVVCWDDSVHDSKCVNHLSSDQITELVNQTENLFMSAGLDPYYAEWLRLHRPTPLELALERTCQLSSTPLFSIVVPLFRTPLDYFDEMIESVYAQSYQNWQLILVNASPENVALHDRVSRAAEADSRVCCINLSKNSGISLNTNAGIEAASGDFVCFLDHDDLLEPDALFSYAEAVCNNSSIDLLYCDEDILDADGEYKAPFFKPDFDPELLRVKNYIAHFLTIRKSLLDRLELSTPEFDGAQDYHLTLQATEQGRAICHIPRVLYHWRVCESSSSKNAENKPYAADAGKRALAAHLERTGMSARILDGKYPFSYRVLYDMPADQPLVSILIPNCDQPDVLRTCISSILDLTTYENFEIVIIENNSKKPETFAYYDNLIQKGDGHIRIERWPGEFNFSKIINFGAARARGEYLLLLNNDTQLLTPDWIERFLGICAQSDVAAAGALLYFPDDTIQHAGVVVSSAANHLFRDMPRGNDGYFHLASCQRRLSAVTAACMIVKRSAFDEVGGFDEAFTVCYNDVDFCLKLRALGYAVVYTPEVELYHYESLSRGVDDFGEKRGRQIAEQALLSNKWAYHFGKGDPYYSPNVAAFFPLNSWYHF